MTSTSLRNDPDTTGRVHSVSFSADGFRLSGTLHLPCTDKPPTVIGSHGLVADSSSPKQTELAKRCTALGMAYFRFDHRGRGNSEGVFDEVTSLQARCNDLLSAVEVLKSRKDVGDRIALFGSSMGGAVCIACAGQINAVCLVTYAAPVRSRAKNRRKKHQSHGPKPRDLSLEGKKLKFDLSDRLSSVHHILIIHGDADLVVPVSSAGEIYEKAGEPKKLILQPGGDHPMSMEQHQKQFIRDSVDWFRTFLFT